MNFLAHLYVADRHPERHFGNVLADFIRGNEIERFSHDIQFGVRQHRALDAFTDSHHAFRASAALIKPVWGRYSMVLMDMFTDHFLAVDWDVYSDMALRAFTEECHRMLRDHEHLMPPQMQQTMNRMIEHRWLESYREVDNVQRALAGLSRRFVLRPVDLAPAVEQLEEHYNELRGLFHDFFPEAIAFSHAFAQESAGR